MTQWEYRTAKVRAGGVFSTKIDDLDMEDYMNELGVEGWELVSAISPVMAGGYSKEVILMFKREGTTQTSV
ncbi:MAG: DUF4177 domain-containing protein [Gammaproteobacteria bacterium]|nr:DUF4177 domain-containing protein [Gammaproteobacteria bacterium]